MSTKVKSPIKYENFDLRVAKLVDGKVAGKYFDAENPNREIIISDANLSHSDLQDALDELSIEMAMALGNLTGYDYARENLRGGENLSQLEGAMKGYEERVKQHHVSGLRFVGGERPGIQITGSVKSDLGSTGLAAPKIYFDSDKIGYGEAAMEKAEKVKKEVFAYLFQGKSTPKKSKATEEADPNQTSLLDAEQSEE